VGNPEVEDYLEKVMHMWQCNIKMDRK